jgi:RNA methyltransferase, TrmH family
VIEKAFKRSSGPEKKHTIVEQAELEIMGTLETNAAALAVVKQKNTPGFAITSNDLVLALDDIRDPGNLGTIIRIADWYGIKKILCSEKTTDMYDPKVISATMGSFARVEVMYTNLAEVLEHMQVPSFGTYLEGENIENVHEVDFPKGGILVMGSESHGISNVLKPLIKKKITIPAFGKAESLNVAIATAIVLDNWKRSGA